MAKKQAKKLELRLCRAMDKAIEMGYYPDSMGGAEDGACCVLEAYIIEKDGNIKSLLDDKMPFKNSISNGLVLGFGGWRRDISNPQAYAIGERLAKRYLVQE